MLVVTLNVQDFENFSKSRFLGKIGQGSALSWFFLGVIENLENFGILNCSKCQFLEKFDQGSALSWFFLGLIEKFGKSENFKVSDSRKIWPGLRPILILQSFM